MNKAHYVSTPKSPLCFYELKEPQNNRLYQAVFVFTGHRNTSDIFGRNLIFYSFWPENNRNGHQKAH